MNFFGGGKDESKVRKEAQSEIKSLVESQKISYLKEGTFIEKYHHKTGKSTICFVRLSKDSKALDWGEARPGTDPKDTKLDNRLALKEIKSLATGRKMSTWSRVKKDPDVVQRSFALNLRGENPSFEATVPDMITFVGWTDGIRAVMRAPMEDVSTLQEMKALVELEVEVRLLPDVSKPKTKPPSIPEPPKNLDFIVPIDDKKHSRTKSQAGESRRRSPSKNKSGASSRSGSAAGGSGRRRKSADHGGSSRKKPAKTSRSRSRERRKDGHKKK